MTRLPIKHEKARFVARIASLAFSLLVCHGCSGAKQAVPKSGWKRIHWDAGNGSWAFGGAGVAYDLDIPNEYEFSNKLGRARIYTGVEAEACPVIELCYWTASMNTSIPIKDPQGKTKMLEISPDAEFKKLIDMSNTLAEQFPDKFSPLKISPARSVTVNGIPFQRIDMSCQMVPQQNAANKSHHEGFRLKGQNIDIVVTLQEPKKFKISEEIINTLKRS